ncbi:hydroquinone glucosyltransferase-like [Gastrolobium bilobum]|uniref:hydroquinone glucosyltransferase-like n=1 Tax=Gastrolobium bilobum TaxID=150636 RepID=UPI002AB103D4|nr:hydroquinone glucosyltransferase-like [Gastrolobium bilobum]
MEDQQQCVKPKLLESPLPIVAMMPSSGMGHLIPMIEFAKRLTCHHNLAVTFIIPTDGPPSKAQTTVLRSLPRAISHIFLPPVTLSDLPLDTKVGSLICNIVLRSLPSLRRALLSLTATHRVAAFVVDFIGTDAFDVIREFNVPPYIFFPSTAMFLSFSFYVPQLDKAVQCEFRDLPEPVQIPGCVPVHGKDLVDGAYHRNSDCYKWLLHHSKRFSMAEGIIENSFYELEPETIEFLHSDEPGRPPIYPVGPLVNEDSPQTGDEECLRWLDEQPRGSVIFVCFGSGGTLSSAQMNELALGLEMSEQRFLWVVKSPNEKIANASYFIVDSHSDPFDFLPKGFVERTKERGLVVPSWAPQAQVLSHESIGGFLTHCGWNSILESVVNGVPLVAWPLYAEQTMNAVLVTQDMRVALRPKVNENGLVEREEIGSVVKNLMEGEEGKKLRYRMKDLKVAADKALGENGSSTKQISLLALKWQGKTTVTN